MLVADNVGLVGVWYSKERYFDENSIVKHQSVEMLVFKKARKWFDIYFSGGIPKIDFPLNFTGTKFQNEVWSLLCSVPYGKTITYGDLAKKVAQKQGVKYMSAQAVGGAVSRNNISIIVPCHRVIGVNGNLTGYAGGMDKKIFLLKLEKSYKENFFVPKKKI